jgi:glycosyltransferase involved in cell wall biosynthesis
LKICQITDFIDVGGAGIAASRIGDALCEVENVEICRVSTSKKSNSKEVTYLQNSRKIQLLSFCSQYFKNSFLKKLNDLDICKQLEKILQLEKPDIINVHNIHSSGWPIGLIKTCLKYAPVSWTLHDCWSFLGCYYQNYCPPPDKKLKDKLEMFWRHPEPNLYATTPSRWLQKEALNSYWSDFKVKAIHNPIPKSFFENKNSHACKEALGLKLNIPIVLVVAGNLNEKRKGGGVLKSILESNITDKAQFLLIGNGENLINENVKSIGFITDEITIQIAYHAADILLHPAPIDNLPNTVAESISCGTPVLAFNTGGIPEMVIPDKSGWLINKIEAQQMLEMLEIIIADESFLTIRKSTREIGLNLFNSEKIGISYLNHFKDMIFLK